MKPILLLTLLVATMGCQVRHSLSDLYWQKRLERAVGDGAPPPDDGLCPTNSAAWLHWEEKTKLTTVGMSRSEVEKILPFYDFPERGPHPSIGKTLVNNPLGNKDLILTWYYVASDFIAVFFYDKTGPLNIFVEGPNQRLMHPPVLIHHDFTKASAFYFPEKTDFNSLTNAPKTP